VFDQAGNVIGGGVCRLDALKIAGRVGDHPQDVNFAICKIVRAFPEAKGLVVCPPQFFLSVRHWSSGLRHTGACFNSNWSKRI